MAIGLWFYGFCENGKLLGTASGCPSSFRPRSRKTLRATGSVASEIRSTSATFSSSAASLARLCTGARSSAAQLARTRWRWGCGWRRRRWRAEVAMSQIWKLSCEWTGCGETGTRNGRAPNHCTGTRCAAPEKRFAAAGEGGWTGELPVTPPSASGQRHWALSAGDRRSENPPVSREGCPFPLARSCGHQTHRRKKFERVAINLMRIVL